MTQKYLHQVRQSVRSQQGRVVGDQKQRGAFDLRHAFNDVAHGIDSLWTCRDNQNSKVFPFKTLCMELLLAATRGQIRIDASLMKARLLAVIVPGAVFHEAIF
jgi:hypothetical protein